ncbi:n1r p28-like protein [Lasius niger]|uniref:N1r p28-like protein n=1 Tax=Lasius niger TaxID=67767 RepID=A0A0J7MNE1_LASNI|nr:n1r p28-like protein [Lasius niger]
MANSTESLEDICYEQIKNNYHRGIFTDFQLVIDKPTSYFNVTQLCKDVGKNFQDWLDNRDCKMYLSYLETKLGARSGRLFKRVREEVGVLRGIYAPKELLIPILMWVSPEFAITLNNNTIQSNANRFNVKYKDQKDHLQKRIEAAELKMRKLRMQNKRFKTVRAKRAPVKLSVIVIVEKKDGDQEYRYYIVRCQKTFHKKTMKDLISKFPNLKVIREITYNQTKVNLIDRIKECIYYAQTRYNHLKVDDIDKFVRDVEDLIPTTTT